MQNKSRRQIHAIRLHDADCIVELAIVVLDGLVISFCGANEVAHKVRNLLRTLVTVLLLDQIEQGLRFVQDDLGNKILVQ